MLDFGLVREALQERGLLLTRLAPHLVRPVSFLYPLSKHAVERPFRESPHPSSTATGGLIDFSVSDYGPSEHELVVFQTVSPQPRALALRTRAVPPTAVTYLLVAG